MTISLKPGTLVPPGYFETLGHGITPGEQILARSKWCKQNPLSIEWSQEPDPKQECLFDCFKASTPKDPDAPLGRSAKEVLLWKNGKIIDFPPNRAYLKDKCFKTLGAIETLVQTEFDRHPINTSSHKLSVYIDYDSSFAYWNGKRNVVCFRPLTEEYSYIKTDGFAKAPTVLGHEIGHGFVQYNGADGYGLKYSGQSGALNESFADILGIMTKHSIEKTMANHPNCGWKIGRIFKPGTYKLGGNVITYSERDALRSMSHPGTANPRDCQVTKTGEPIDHFKRYINDLPLTEDGDWGGVHYNSGIPNKAFQLAATALQGYTWGKVGKIWFHALYKSTDDITLADFSELAAKKAKDLYGAQEESIVRQAWKDVGVVKEAPSQPSLSQTARDAMQNHANDQNNNLSTSITNFFSENLDYHCGKKARFE